MTTIPTLTSLSAQRFADERHETVYVCLCPRFEEGDGGLYALIIFGHELQSSDIVLCAYAPNGAA